ncbi:hypothetical protein PEBR_08787 [Penicillium brasilianum]|uniref:Myb-like DNA-binding domain-containing protein n=1 Tax=Penicillium brasilianum TaxID=104259 RepID=A0A1S9S248_PENBI|nr:hypothetical protein PEBR_08787 [Penicillium brasilianum]
MSPASKEKDINDDPSKDPMWFLITVIMNTEAKKLEKIDWDSVAEKMDIKTKGAAMKRYERLLGTYGLTTSYLAKQGVQSPGPAQGKGAATGGPSTSSKKRTPSKRKRANLEKDDDAENDKAPAPLDDEAGTE